MAIMMRRGIGMAAAAGLLIAGATWLLSGPGMPAHASVLDAARAAFDEVRAIRVATWFDSGPGTERSAPDVVLIDAERGARSVCAGRIDLYDARAGERSWFDVASGVVEVVVIDEEVPLRRLLGWGRAEENLEALRVLALRDEGRVTQEVVERDGVLVRRLVGTDEHDRPIEAEIDLASGRVRRTASWTIGDPRAGVPPVRVVREFSYPDPRTLDDALFAAIPPEAREVRRVEGIAQARMQKMHDLRTLAMAVQLYAMHHADQLPRRVDDLVEYLDPARPLEVMLRAAVPGRDEALRVESALAGFVAEGITTVAGLDPQAVLFRLAFPDGSRLEAYVDGHVETHGPPNDEADEPDA